jgi:hypothetical protein
MNLYPLLYVNEAAKTSGDAVSSKLGLIVGEGRAGKKDIVLYSGAIARRIYERHLERPEEAKEWSARSDFLFTQLAEQAIVGIITYKNHATNLVAVKFSAATNKFGPLLYEIAMGMAEPKYVHSDYQLTKGSRTVWQKMYERTDVEKKWLGYFFANIEDAGIHLAAAADACGVGSQIRVQKFIYDIKNQEGRWNPEAAEQLFEKNVLSKIGNRSKFGAMYAYRLTAGNALTDYNKLLSNGESFAEELAGAFKLSTKRVKKEILNAGDEFFMNLYMNERKQ